MKFIVMHKVDDHMEAGGKPDMELVQKMGALVQRGLASGEFLDGAGLHPSAHRIRVTCRGGACSQLRGPYRGGNELVARVIMIKARSIEAAAEHAARLAVALGDAEIEIGPVVEAWDLGIGVKPEGLDISRFLLLIKADALSETGAPTPAAITTFVAELDQAGVLLTADELAPSKRGTRLRAGARGSRRSWVDGPFAESKEMIAGYSIIDLPSIEHARAWAEEYAAILDGNEVDVRELGPSLLPA